MIQRISNKWPKTWSDINLFELTLLMFSLWASFSSSRQKRSEGGNAPSPASTQSWVSPSYPWHPESVTAYDFLFQIPRGAKQDARVLLCVGRDIPSVYTWSVYCSESQTASVSTYSKWTDESVCVSILYIKAGSRKFCLRSRSVNISWNLWL